MEIPEAAMQYAQALSVSTEWLIANIAGILGAIAILVIGYLGAGFLEKQIRKLLPLSRRVDPTLTLLLSQITRYGVLIITFIIVLGQFGVQTASILAVLGAAGLAIALALQGTLANIAAGVMLIWLRPFSIGDAIDAQGANGNVVEIGLFATTVRTYDGLHVFVPNSQLWGSRITNFSREPTRLVEIKIGISYDSDLARAREVLLGLTRDERVLPDPAPYVFVNNLGANAIEIALRAWVKTSDWWDTRNSFNERAKLGFDAAGVQISYNKLDVNIISAAARAAEAEQNRG